MFNGKQVEHDVTEQILFGYMESLTYERPDGSEFKVWTDTEDGENLILYLSYRQGKRQIPWECVFLKGVVEEVADELLSERRSENVCPH